MKLSYLEKRGENSWRVEVDLGSDPLTGKRKRVRRTFTASGQREAEKKAVQIEAEILQTGFVDSRNMSVEEYLRIWLQSHTPNVAPATAYKYEGAFENHVIPALGHIKLSKLEPIHIQKFYSDKLAAGLSNRTVHHYHAQLKTALKYAVKPLKLIAFNPADDVIPPRPKGAEMIALTAPELAKLLSSAKRLLYFSDLPYYGIILTAAYTGMRKGELLALNWQNVDFINKLIRVKQSLRIAKKGKSVIGPPKTKNSYRSITVSKEVLDVLKAIMVQQKKNKLKLGDGYENPDNLVFTYPNGNAIYPTVFWHKFGCVKKDAGLTLRFHDLRHTHITLLLQAGMNPKIVAERNGHTINTLLEVYAHVMPNMQKEVVEKFDSLLSADNILPPNSAPNALGD